MIDYEFKFCNRAAGIMHIQGITDKFTPERIDSWKWYQELPSA